MISKILRHASFCIVITYASVVSAQNVVDVYFITGQSNAGNLSELNSYDVGGYDGNIPPINTNSFDNQSEQGFTLTFGRIPDRSSRGPVTAFVESFSESSLDPTNYALDNLAVEINAGFGNDIGIFSFGRNGRSLGLTTDNTGNAINEDWFPGTVAQPYNLELYGQFLTFSALRIAEVEAGPDGVAGTADDQIANVRGIFWFQGETDSDDQTNREAYGENFANLVARFRDTFGNPELPIVASEIRRINANDEPVNDGLNEVAGNDPFVTVIDISDTSIYPPVNTGNVHLNADGFHALSSDFANAIIELLDGDTSEPEPGAPLTTSTSPPTTNIISSELSGATDSAIFSEAGNSNHARGQFFSLGDGAGTGYEISALTIRKSTTQTYQNATLTVRIFEGNASQFLTGTGHDSTIDGDDFFVGTTVTPICSEVFELDGTIADNNFVTFNFTEPVQVDEMSDLGFLITFEPGSGSEDRFRYREGTQGERMAVTDTSHAVSETRSFHYAVQGTSFTAFLLGDLNRDDQVNFFDISPFIALLSTNGFLDEADINGDGVVNFFDIGPFIGLLSSN